MLSFSIDAILGAASHHHPASHASVNNNAASELTLVDLMSLMRSQVAASTADALSSSSTSSISSSPPTSLNGFKSANDSSTTAVLQQMALQQQFALAIQNLLTASLKPTPPVYTDETAAISMLRQYVAVATSQQSENYQLHKSISQRTNDRFAPVTSNAEMAPVPLMMATAVPAPGYQGVIGDQHRTAVPHQQYLSFVTSARKRTRMSFGIAQVRELERKFREKPYLTPRDRDELALRLGLTGTQVKIWFQNRRYKIKKTTVSATMVANTTTSSERDGATKSETDFYGSSSPHSMSDEIDIDINDDSGSNLEPGTSVDE